MGCSSKWYKLWSQNFIVTGSRSLVLAAVTKDACSHARNEVGGNGFRSGGVMVLLDEVGVRYS
jgi:hypothetical protein